MLRFKNSGINTGYIYIGKTPGGDGTRRRGYNRVIHEEVVGLVTWNFGGNDNDDIIIADGNQVFRKQSVGEFNKDTWIGWFREAKKAMLTVNKEYDYVKVQYRLFNDGKYIDTIFCTFEGGIF